MQTAQTNDDKLAILELENLNGKLGHSLFDMMCEYVINFRLTPYEFGRKVKKTKLQMQQSLNGMQQRVYGIQGCIWSMMHQKRNVQSITSFGYHFQQSLECPLRDVKKELENMRKTLEECFDKDSPVFKNYVD